MGIELLAPALVVKGTIISFAEIQGQYCEMVTGSERTFRGRKRRLWWSCFAARRTNDLWALMATMGLGAHYLANWTQRTRKIELIGCWRCGA